MPQSDLNHDMTKMSKHYLLLARCEYADMTKKSLKQQQKHNAQRHHAEYGNMVETALNYFQR